MSAEDRKSQRTRGGFPWRALLWGFVWAVGGFGLGVAAGTLWEEPRLVASFGAGLMDEVPAPGVAPIPEEIPAAVDPPPLGAPEPRLERVQKPAPKAPMPPVAAAPPGAGTPSSGFAVQVGSFAEQEAARRLADTLRAKGHRVFIAAGDSGSSTRWRVRVGPFDSDEQARDWAARLKREQQLPTWVMNLEEAQ